MHFSFLSRSAITRYTALGGIAVALLPMLAHAQTPAPVTVVEYYNKTIASYFLTGRASEQAALDTVADFQRTGVSFTAVAAGGAVEPLYPICRYRIAVAGSNFSSHFYGLPLDCSVIDEARLAQFSYEGTDFSVETPTSGACPASSPVPIYRALRAITPVDVPNHCYSVSAAAYADMLTRGWKGEGVVFCAKSATPETQRPTYSLASTYSASCEVPRVGVNQYTGATFGDVQGTRDNEKNWLRSYSDQTYLWYREIPSANPANYATTSDWFSVLKTPALAISGAAKDRFHFTQSTEERDAANSGVSFGYGISWSRISSTRPRSWLVAVVTPGSPADIAGVKRGDSLTSIDGEDFRTTANFGVLNAGLFPSNIGESHSFVFTPINSTTTKSATLPAASVAIKPVPASGVITTPTGRVGYIAFTTFNTFTSERAIADAVASLVAAGGITDLVLDLRYNGGGYVFISAETAFMIAGNARTSSKTFELLKSNDKKPFGADDPDLFYNIGSGAPGGVSATERLPSLNLGRVYVLTQAGTCSASESLINGLRGIDVEVILIGGQTCGKPYAFASTDNCGVTYSTIQFTGVNNKGQGDYIDGFAPTCKANDDLSAALGNPAEGQLAAALKYRATGVCAPVVATSVEKIGNNGANLTANTNEPRIREFARQSDNEKIATPKDLPRNLGARITPAPAVVLGAVNGAGITTE